MSRADETATSAAEAVQDLVERMDLIGVPRHRQSGVATIVVGATRTRVELVGGEVLHQAQMVGAEQGEVRLARVRLHATPSEIAGWVSDAHGIWGGAR